MLFVSDASKKPTHLSEPEAHRSRMANPYCPFIFTVIAIPSYLCVDRHTSRLPHDSTMLPSRRQRGMHQSLLDHTKRYVQIQFSSLPFTHRTAVVMEDDVILRIRDADQSRASFRMPSWYILQGELYMLMLLRRMLSHRPQPGCLNGATVSLYLQPLHHQGTISLLSPSQSRDRPSRLAISLSSISLHPRSSRQAPRCCHATATQPVRLNQDHGGPLETKYTHCSTFISVHSTRATERVFLVVLGATAQEKLGPHHSV